MRRGSATTSGRASESMSDELVVPEVERTVATGRGFSDLTVVFSYSHLPNEFTHSVVYTYTTQSNIVSYISTNRI
eukprot:SAG31_NODE_1660_length_7599_cov_3.194800_5_plen_75_part_00